MIDIPGLMSAAVSLVSAVVRTIQVAAGSDEAAQKHLDELFSRISQTRAQVHAEAEETKALAEKL